jgi:predicted O-methyltransferase YrrM
MPVNKIFREIARPFKRLRRRFAVGPDPAHIVVQGPIKAATPEVEFLAPTRPLREIMPATDQVEVKLMARLIRSHKWAMPEHELLALGAIVAAVQPRRVFEFGTFMGGSTLVLATNSSEDASLTTIDIGPLPIYKTKYTPGSLYHGTRFQSRIKQLIGDSLEFDPAPYRSSMDLVFVDGNHTDRYAKNDTRLALELVRPGGTVVWHDYTWFPENPECVGVTRAVNAVQAQRGCCYHVAGTRFAILLPK